MFRKLAAMTDPETPRYTPRPGWVKVLGIVALLAVLVTIVVLLVGVPHGPGMHGGLGV